MNSNPYQQLPINPLNEFFQDVCFGNNIFVVAGGDIVTTPDGVNWTRPTIPNGFAPEGVTFANNTFVVVGFGGGGRIMTSPDGTNWTSRFTSTIPNTIYGVTYGNGLFVAAGASGRIVTSPDLVNWTVLNLSSFGGGDIEDVAYGNNLFVAVTSGLRPPSPVKE